MAPFTSPNMKASLTLPPRGQSVTSPKLIALQAPRQCDQYPRYSAFGSGFGRRCSLASGHAGPCCFGVHAAALCVCGAPLSSEGYQHG